MTRSTADAATICEDCKATVTESGYCVMCGKYNAPADAASWEWPNSGPMIDLTCSTCNERGKGTYKIPVGCMNCDLQVVGIFSRGHEAYPSQRCPDCGCTTLSSNYARKAKADATV